MFLNIILTILVIVLITITVLLVRWWRKYGKGMMDSTIDIRKLTGGVNPNFGSDIDIMKEMLKKFDSKRKSNNFFGK